MIIKPFNPLFHNFNTTPSNQNGDFSLPKQKPQLQHDTVSFTGKRDLLKQPKEKIFRKIQESMKPQNVLGEGVEAAVYKINGTEYCIRRPFFSKDIESDFNLEISIKDKINHVVAKLGNGCRIMNIIKGVPIATIDETNGEKLEHIEELIEEFPVESYNKLIKQITFAFKNEMVFDAHWANVIMDSEKKTLTAIDFYPMDNYDTPDICKAEPLSSIFPAVMNMKANFQQMQTCTKKLLKAGLEEMKPNYTPHIKPEEFDFTRFIKWLHSYNKINLTAENLTLLAQSFDRIINLKNKELEGKAVKRNLAREIDSTNKIIDKVL